MKSLQSLQQDWEQLAQLDPMWAICADPAKRDSWNPEAFFATGRQEIDHVLGCVTNLGLSPDPDSRVLDFGCGVGRLTRALALHFRECWGVDISPTMVRLAREFNQDVPACKFMLNEKETLEQFPDRHFSFIYTSIVLQHIRTPFAKRYLREMIRLLQPAGILVFQVPDRLLVSPWMKLRMKIALRTRMRRLLGKRPPVDLMEMNCVSEPEVRDLVGHAGARVIDVRLTNSVDPSFSGRLDYLSQEPAEGYVSKQYCVVRE